MKKGNMTIEFTVGLPASGKSTWAISQKDNNTKIIDVDKMRKNGIVDFNDEFCSIRYYRNISRIIVDGLFLDLSSVVSFVEEHLSDFDYDKIILHCWKEDRKQCLINDEGRRNVSSADTINFAEYHMPTTEDVKKAFGEKGSYQIHYVYIMSDFDHFLRSNNLKYVTKDNILYSDSWAISGYTEGYDHNQRYPITPSEPIENFEEFDSLLEKICPEISFLVYKKLMKECVSMVEHEENDYYSRITYVRWECDLKKLYELLKEMEKI